MEIKTCAICHKTSETVAIVRHHVLGRVGAFHDEPYNLIDLCYEHHFLWHNNRPKIMERQIYQIMKDRHGDKFPMIVNGVPYKTKWFMRAEDQINGQR
jgi:hypothetical protein